MRIRHLILCSLMLPLTLGSCSIIRPDGTLASLTGHKVDKPKSYSDRNHIKPTLPSGQLRWKVIF